MHKLLKVAAVGVAGLAASVPAFATYTAQSYTGVSEAVTGEITAAITTGMPLFGLVLGVFIARRVIKSFAKG